MWIEPTEMARTSSLSTPQILTGRVIRLRATDGNGADAISRESDLVEHPRLKLTRGGKVVATVTTVVSQDGKSLTLTAAGTDEKGKKFKTIVVYDKQ